MTGMFAIVRRELAGLLRMKRTVLVLVLVALAFSVVVLAKWPTSATADMSGHQARGVFRWLAYAMFFAVALIVPAFPATGLIREVRRRTMELLLNSPLQPWHIFLGKLLAMLVFCGMLMAVTLPAMACSYAMGALAASDVLTLYALLTLFCVELIVFGLLVGTFARTPEAGLRWAYGVMFSVVVIALIPHLFLQHSDSIYARVAETLRHLSPVPALQQLIGDQATGGAGLIIEATNLISRYFIIGIPLSFMAAGVCIYGIRNSLMDRSRDPGVMTEDRSGAQRVARRVFYLVDPQKRKSGIPWYLNPLLVKEFRSRQFGRLHWLIRMVAGCAVLSLLLTLATTMGTLDWGVEKVGGIMIVAQVCLVIALTPGLSGAMIAGEIESGGWDLLRATPMRVSRVLRGKLLSVSITLLLVLCASLPGYGIIMVIKPVLQTQVTQVIASLGITALVAMLVSAVVSSFCRSTAVATTIAYGALVTLYGGSLLIWVNRDAPFSHGFVETALSVNAMAGALNAMGVEGFQIYEGLLRTTWMVSAVLCAALVVVLYFRTRRLWEPD